MVEEIKRIEEFFNSVTFTEEDHTYWVGGNKLKISVSGLVKKFKYPTDWDEVRRKYALKNNLNEKDVEKTWKDKGDEACKLGSKSHKFGELYPFDRTLVPSTNLERAIKKFWDNLPEHIIPVKLELVMFHKKYKFGGTADIILYNTIKNVFYIADYKTNEELFKNFNGQRMCPPFQSLLCHNFNHYQLQLSYYQILLEQVPDIKVEKRILIWLKRDSNYELYPCENYTSELKNKLEVNFWN